MVLRRVPAVTALGPVLFLCAATLPACWKKSNPSVPVHSDIAGSRGTLESLGKSSNSEEPAAPRSASPSGRQPIAPSEILKRAMASGKSSRGQLSSLRDKPSAHALAAVCGNLGELEAYLVSLAFLVNDGFLAHNVAVAAPQSAPMAPAEGLSDPMQWVSSAAGIAPLCGRRGSSLEDFLDDISNVEKNLGAVELALGRIALPVR